MLTLYTKATCPFCSRVVAVIDRLGLEVAYKDIAEDDTYADELIARGGKRQVPYLVDETASTEMYESDTIVSYLQKTYGQPAATAGKPRIHINDATCVSCEG